MASKILFNVTPFGFVIYYNTIWCYVNLQKRYGNSGGKPYILNTVEP